MKKQIELSGKAKQIRLLKSLIEKQRNELYKLLEGQAELHKSPKVVELSQTLDKTIATYHEKIKE